MRGHRAQGKPGSHGLLQRDQITHLVGKLLDENEGANEDVGLLHVMLERFEVLLVAQLLHQIPNDLQRPHGEPKSPHAE